MGFYNEFNKKEKPVFSGITRGTGGFGFGATGGGELGTTGGTIVESGGKKYHVFYPVDSHSFVVVDDINNIEMLLIGSGGSGSQGFGSAGGGAGGVVHATGITCPGGTYPIVIGDGGAPVAGPASGDCEGNTGSPSTATLGSQPYIATGGGGGGSGHSGSPQPTVYGNPGGSGGGGGYYAAGGSYPNQGGSGVAPPTSPNSGNSSQTGGISYQNPGGDGDWSVTKASQPNGQCGGGGGGANQNGGSAPEQVPARYGQGGNGISITSFPATVIGPAIPTATLPGAQAPTVAGSPMPSASSTTQRAAFTAVVGPTGLYGGGGGGGYIGGPWLGGIGGGGNGSLDGNEGRFGVDGTGSGGGCASGGSLGSTSGKGGSGICIISYPN